MYTPGVCTRKVVIKATIDVTYRIPLSTVALMTG
jgi:hypothetical protein